MHIAHNVKIGKHNLLAGQVGIAGSAKLGEHVYCGGQVGILGHNFIEDHVTFYPKSALMNVGKTIPLVKYPAQLLCLVFSILLSLFQKLCCEDLAYLSLQILLLFE